MKAEVFAILPLVLSVGAFLFEEGIPDSRCPLQDNPMNPMHLPHPTDCGRFYKCFSGRAFAINCPPGQEFGAQLQRCDFPQFARCRTALAEPEPAQIHLKEQETVAEQSEIEALPVKAEFIYSAGVPDVRCPRNDDPFRPIHLAHTDCTKFQKCFDGRAYVLDCPPGQHFGVKINRCDFPQFAQCLQSKRKSISKREVKYSDEEYDYNYDEDDLPLDPSEWTDEQREMVVGVNDFRCPRLDDPETPVHLTHPKDCGKFYKCYGGRAYLIVCPAGQHWSVRFDRCDYPKVAKFKVHSPHIGSTDDSKDEFYTQLEREYDHCPRHDIKIVIGDYNAQVGQEEVLKLVTGRFSAH
ncbi:probable chitinase 10 [Sabethes cyaneus]|uniref:probable chitinase 10 n=1 Tax=Sabethes cyaneus TaxID=53552 RepID=UPI00237EA5CA|nr:probable chitinase 10 [Sabethes cyaneus]